MYSAGLSSSLLAPSQDNSWGIFTKGKNYSVTIQFLNTKKRGSLSSHLINQDHDKKHKTNWGCHELETNSSDISGRSLEAFDTNVPFHWRNFDRFIEHLVLLQIPLLLDELAEPRPVWFSLVRTEYPWSLYDERNRCTLRKTWIPARIGYLIGFKKMMSYQIRARLIRYCVIKISLWIAVVSRLLRDVVTSAELWAVKSTMESVETARNPSVWNTANF